MGLRRNKRWWPFSQTRFIFQRFVIPVQIPCDSMTDVSNLASATPTSLTWEDFTGKSSLWPSGNLAWRCTIGQTIHTQKHNTTPHTHTHTHTARAHACTHTHTHTHTHLNCYPGVVVYISKWGIHMSRKSKSWNKLSEIVKAEVLRFM